MSNESGSALLGLNVSTATARLRKLIMWSLVQETGQDACFRCGEQIENIDDLSIEHKEPWRKADDPKASFFDLDNIAFSHLSCNIGAADRSNQPRKTHCLQGHEYTDENTYTYSDGARQCRQCDRRYQAVYRSSLGEERNRSTQEWQKRNPEKHAANQRAWYHKKQQRRVV